MRSPKIQAAEANGERSGSLTKALDIIEATVRQPIPSTTAELAALLGLAKPTAHRVVNSLRELGYLKREPGSSRLVEGDRLVALALDVLASAAQRGPRHNILHALAEQTGETANLGVMASGQVVYVDRVETKWPLGLRFDVGSRVPIHCTALGKMFLSFMSERQRDKYLTTLPLTRYTENTRTRREDLEADLERIRADGVSFDNCEFMSGVVCLAVPVRGPSGRVVAGVAISAPEARLTVEEARPHVAALREAAERLAITFDDPGHDHR
ncbi:IclR family transcriptional regulator [Spiribacter halobius]|uniref:HTH-type transcriptional repressor AllR n=1 Tax=Sediminicurvatus halobius TaxID=2182432 RepID=A0A2U2N656_9GAMM|nr:IclR family transcriptional regulator [Spiribacter halobius]PWG64537.1 IclR family transcriptional regulator [Spiribacter halobius]UEX79139.1 IclR family transcriptional regulator [Spiribacter halobius]